MLGPGVRVQGWGHLGSDELLPEARGLPVGDHRGLLEDLFEPGVALHHDAVTLCDYAGDGGQRRVIHDREHHLVHLLLLDYSLDGLITRDQESLLNIFIDELSLISAVVQHVSELGHPCVSLPSISAEGQTVQDIVCTVGRMTKAGEL